MLREEQITIGKWTFSLKMISYGKYLELTKTSEVTGETLLKATITNYTLEQMQEIFNEMNLAEGRELTAAINRVNYGEAKPDFTEGGK